MPPSMLSNSTKSGELTTMFPLKFTGPLHRPRPPEKMRPPFAVSGFITGSPPIPIAPSLLIVTGPVPSPCFCTESEPSLTIVPPL